MANTYDICIRGAGIVGRALALLLAREKLRVALVAPAGVASGSATGHGDVRAYALNVASRRLLESLRCWPPERSATPVLRMAVQGDDGGAVSFDALAQGSPALTWIVDVPALEGQLADAVRFQPQIDLVDVPVDAALTVVCEGKASRTRSEFGVEFNARPYPQTAVATRLTTEKPHEQTAWQWFSKGEILAFLPLDGWLAGHAARLPGPVRLLKVDVEGAEPAVLRGAAGLLAGARPLVLLEVDAATAAGAEAKFADCRRILAAHGYGVERLPAAYPGLAWHVIHLLARPAGFPSTATGAAGA